MVLSVFFSEEFLSSLGSTSLPLSDFLELLPGLSGCVFRRVIPSSSRADLLFLRRDDLRTSPESAAEDVDLCPLPRSTLLISISRESGVIVASNVLSASYNKMGENIEYQ